MIKKIVIIGPESTGKSMLCEKLAAHFKTALVPEYAREYLLNNGTDYGLNDLQKIAAGQLDAEDSAASMFQQDRGLLFIDTDLYVIKVWSEYVFNSCHNSILTGIASRNYDLYLLCNPDIPWVKDALREYPDLPQREKLYHFYKDAMVNQHVPWVEIQGDYDTRFQTALAAVHAIVDKES